MTRRAIDIDDETWRRIKVEAAEQGITVRELVNRYLSIPLGSRRKKTRVDWSNVVVDEGDEAP